MSSPGGLRAQRNLLGDQRRSFLRTIQELCPEVLTSLRKNVLPSFVDIFEIVRAVDGEPFLRNEQGELVDRSTVLYRISGSDRLAGIAWEDLREFDPEGAALPSYAREFAVSLDPKRVAVRQALNSWGAEFHLDTEWVFDEALATMLSWLQRSEQRADVRWALYSLEADFSFEDLASVPALLIDEKWAFEPLSAMRERLQSRWKEYESEVKAYAKRIGFSLSRPQPKRREHQWLALERCKGYNATQIIEWQRQHDRATSQEIRSDTIRHTLKNVAEELGLRPLRRSPGRPTTRKT